MTKSKIFMGIGSLVLASAAILAAKPAKKFATVTGIFKQIGPGGVDATVQLTSTHFTYVQSGSLKTAILKTSANTKIRTLLTAIAGTQKVYFKP